MEAQAALPPCDVVIAPRVREWAAQRNFAHWPAVVAGLEAHGLRVGVAGAEDTSLPLPGLVRAWEHPGGATAGSVDLLSRCQLFIGTDSGVAHLAALMDVASLIIPNREKRARTAEMRATNRGHFTVLPLAVHERPEGIAEAVRAFLQIPQDRGAIILSTGPRRHLLVNAARSFRRHNRLRVQIVSESGLEGMEWRAVSPLVGRASRAEKTLLMARSPFELGVILDDDTYTLGELPEIESVLGDCDLAMRPDHYSPTMGESRAHHLRGWSTIEEVEATAREWPDLEAHPHYNSGVIFFRKTPAIVELARVWREEWERFRDIDQFALYRALRRTGLLARVATLPDALHHRVGKGSFAEAKVAHLIRAKRDIHGWLAARGLPDYSAGDAPVAAAMLRYRGAQKYRTIENATTPMPRAPGPLPAVWGPPAWARLHEWAQREYDASDRAAWLEGFTRSLPRCDCKSHWRAMLAKTPPPLTGSSEELYAWTVDRHNEVNARLGKAQFIPAARGRE